MNPGDSVALEKCGVNLPHELNPYRWPVSTTPVGNSYRTRIALPVCWQYLFCWKFPTYLIFYY